MSCTLHSQPHSLDGSSYNVILSPDAYDLESKLGSLNILQSRIS